MKYFALLSLAICLSFIIACGSDEGNEPTNCSNFIMDGDETGIDCGGSCPTCNESPTCSDGLWNGNETGPDCGGPDCAACESCNDGIQNQNETDIDCGGICGSSCPTCSDGLQNGDEEGIDCGGSVCSACPTCSDGMLNQGEEGIDCGGPCADCGNIDPLCQLPTNSSNFPTGFTPPNDTHTVACGLGFQPFVGLWTMQGTGNNSDLRISFPRNAFPNSGGVYETVTSNTIESYGPNDKVIYIRTLAGGAFEVLWIANANQDVYIELLGEQIIATFCDLQFADSTGQFPSDITVSGSLQCSL